MASKRIAVILAGAVAKGAFSAGVVQALARMNVQVVRIVAASSGALNGLLFAAGIRARDPVAAADRLVELWSDHGGWSQVFHVSLGDLVRREGVSDDKNLLALIRDNVKPNPSPPGADIELRLVVAPLHGARGSIAGQPATTFEHVLDFAGTAFDSEAGLEPMFAAATASAALPIAFAPVDLPGLGPCVDGGAVNNTPIKWALEGELGRSIDAVVVVTTSMQVLAADPDEELRGTRLIGRFAELLIEERLYRDLRLTACANAELRALAGLRGELGDAAIDTVLAALHWQARRDIEIVTIRPDAQLAGSAFSGFFDRATREQYIAAGRAAAAQALATWT
ncbi:MAG TPA: patatin-like phospholipase family protein [Kofleriaceae bacterium]